MILKRNKHKIESVISETQSGFMAGKGTREGIYNLRTIIERYLMCGKNMFNWLWEGLRQSQTCEDYWMHGKPRHRWERHKLDKKYVLESNSIHENRRRVVTGNSHQERSTTRLCVITAICCAPIVYWPVFWVCIYCITRMSVTLHYSDENGEL